MLGAVAHVGITVRDMDKAVAFYRDVLGLQVLGDVTVGGQEASTVTQVPGTKLRAVYPRYADDPTGPPLELLHFIEPGDNGEKPYVGLTNPGITEVAFWVKDIEKTYAELKAKGVEFYSPPQLFDLGGEGYGKVKAVYFRDLDGTTLELMQNMETDVTA